MPRYRVEVKDTLDDATIRLQIRAAWPKLTKAGVYPSHKALHRAGVRGAHERIGQIRNAMLDEGLLVIPEGLQVQIGTHQAPRPDHIRKPKPPEGGLAEARVIRRVLARRGGAL